MRSNASTAPSADVLSSVDVGPTGFSTPVSRDRLLLEAVADRLRCIELPMAGFLEPWQIDVSSLSSIELARSIAGYAQLAKQHGMDLDSLFAVKEDEVIARAARLAEAVYESRSTSGVAHTDHEYLLRALGVPGSHVRNPGRWYRRALLRHERQIATYFAHVIGEIGKYATPIVSANALESRKRQLWRQLLFARTHQLVCDDGVAGRRAVNFDEPDCTARKRTAKVYVRLIGLEAYCTKQGLVGFFVTLTLPSEYHPNPSKGANLWNGTTPIQGHLELTRMWRIFQRRYGEGHGKCLGVRVEEPHEDGCPHWHILLFVRPELEQPMRDHIAKAFGNRPGIEVKKIDRTRGSGASYLIKHISPDSASNHFDGDLDSKKGAQRRLKAARYDAHRAVWGARAIQFFDLPGSSTLWDEVRRIKPNSASHALLSPDGLRLREAAVANRYGDFLEVLGEKRATSKGSLAVDYSEGLSGHRSVLGLKVDGVVIHTRTGPWTIRPRREQDSQESTKARTVISSYSRNVGAIAGGSPPASE